MKNKRSSEGGSQKVEHSRAKRKSSTETVAPAECVFCGEKERGLSKKQKQSQKLNAAGEYHTSFQSPNVQHVESLTEQRRKMASLLGNTEILSKLHTDIRANELFYHSKCLKTFQYHYKTFLNKSKENNTDTAFKKAVVRESTIALLKQKAYKNPEFPVEARVILEIYNSYLTNENLPQESNITGFGEMII